MPWRWVQDWVEGHPHSLSWRMECTCNIQREGTAVTGNSPQQCLVAVYSTTCYQHWLTNWSWFVNQTAVKWGKFLDSVWPIHLVQLWQWGKVAFSWGTCMLTLQFRGGRRGSVKVNVNSTGHQFLSHDPQLTSWWGHVTVSPGDSGDDTLFKL